MLNILLGNRCKAKDIETLLNTLHTIAPNTQPYTLFSPYTFDKFPQIHTAHSTQKYDFIYLPDSLQVQMAISEQIPYFIGASYTSFLRKIARFCKRLVYRCIDSGIKLTTKPTKQRKLAIIRTDAIGDYLLFRNFLPLFATHYGKVTLVGNIAYKDLITEFDSPHIIEFIPIHTTKFQKNIFYRIKTLKYLRTFDFETLINPIFSRDYLSESLAKFICAKQKIASVGDTSNISYHLKLHFDTIYNTLVSADSRILFEFYRNAEFIKGLMPTISIPSYTLTLNHTNIQEFMLPKRYAVFFIGASSAFRKWSLEHFYEVGKWHINQGFSVVICGGKEDYENGESLAYNLNQLDNITQELDSKAINLCGKTSLGALARVVYNGNHLLSNETSCVHIACAIRHDINIYVVYNGNHLYRFTPYPQGIGSKYYSIYHPTIDKNLAAYGIISNFLQETSRLDINKITPTQVINTIQATL